MKKTAIFAIGLMGYVLVAHANPPRKNYTGSKKGLVILAQFSNKSFMHSNVKAEYEAMLNQQGYKENGSIGSVNEYFYDQSNGKFNLTFDVVGPVTLSHPYSYYGKDGDANAGKMIVEACRLAQAQGTDFSTYDWDGDKEVDQVFVIYAGEGEATGGPAETVWPHEHNLAARDESFSANGVRVNTYACSNEFAYIYQGASRLKRKFYMGIGVFCHEFTHCLGIMDHYDTKGDGYGMGTWDVMSSGSYNGNPENATIPTAYAHPLGYVPAGYTSFEKYSCGWTDYKILGSEAVQVRNMKPLGEGGEAYAIYNPANENEFIALENRGNTKWDSNLAASGLLVTHIDYNEPYWAYNIINSSNGDHPHVSIVPADGNMSAGDENGDIYPNFYGINSLSAKDNRYFSFYNGSTLTAVIKNIVRNADGTISFDYFPNENTTAINGIAEDSDEEIIGIYGINGMKMPDNDIRKLAKGVYIIRMANGERKKITI
ncbi:MAG: M6 family metalloprotease domain-containing protein [Prevotella sp.]|nr:M6 family metalloprotease domain-containing protein [Prevotella sp.]